MLHAYAKSAVAQLPQYLFQTSAAFARKKKTNILLHCKLCTICVNQGKPSFEDAHMYVYVYINKYIYIYTCVSMYVYVVLKVNSFLANLCSIPPRKCNMSLQQIPSMMQ